jgi:hypothetical protein
MPRKLTSFTGKTKNPAAEIWISLTMIDARIDSNLHALGIPGRGTN